MKNNKRGFVVPLLIAIIGILAISGGAYIYSQKNSEISQDISTIDDNQLIQENNPSPTINTETNTKVNVTSPSNTTKTANSGIIVTSIKPNDLVKLPITVEGYLDGNGWTANEGEIGVVEVFDANNKSISNKEIIKTTSDWLKFPTYFSAMVGDRQMMSYIKTNTGYVKIIGTGAKDGEQTKSITIPVRFNVSVSNSNAEVAGKCGLSVFSPLPNEKFDWPLTIKGKVIPQQNQMNNDCSWQTYEGVSGRAQLYFNENNQGWRSVGDDVIFGPNFSFTFNYTEIGLPMNTPMKVVFTEENAAAIRPSLTFELPLILK